MRSKQALSARDLNAGCKRFLPPNIYLSRVVVLEYITSSLRFVFSFFKYGGSTLEFQQLIMAMSPYVVEDNGGEVGRVPAIKKDREMLDLGHMF